MPIRVDDIAVTEKNVLLLSGGHQFIVDIERESDSLDSGNFDRERNPWNFYAKDGTFYHNMFDTRSFDIRTQVLTGSSRHSPNNSRSHERIHMPHETDYVGLCQFYDNGYSITDFTTSTISSDIDSVDGEYQYCSDNGFIRYDVPSAYENPTENYIAPKYLYNTTNGVQFISEYPLNGMYSDFGDNESEGKPTIFADSVLSKYYLDSNYSVSSYDVNDAENSRTLSKFRQMRTYYGIGSTGNSIYAVFRNDRYGESSELLTETELLKTSDEQTLEFPVSGIGYMSNIVTLCDSNSIKYSSEPYADTFDYSAMTSVTGCIDILEPSDKSFILYVNVDGGSTTFTYLPKIGLERSKYTKVIDEEYDPLNKVELEHSVVIGTKGNGVITVWSKDYLYDGSDTLVSFNPFQSACSGIPSFESLSNAIDGDAYGNIRMFYNGSDILGMTAELSGTGGKRMAFFSSNFKDDEREYQIGQFFMPAGNPSYEMEVVSSTETVTTSALSSVPVPSYGNGTESGEITSWSYVLTSVDVTETTVVTSEGFDATKNFVPNIDILFDYSATQIENELSVGYYAFVQFEKYGLGKCHVSDIYSNPKVMEFTSTGPVNEYDSSEPSTAKYCTDVKFAVGSYGDDFRQKLMDSVDYVPNDYNTKYVGGKSALRATFKDSENRYFNSFSVFPLTGREEVVYEPLFSLAKSTPIETSPMTSYSYALEKPIEDSMAVSVKSFGVDGINHDAAISLVKWNIVDGKTDSLTASPSGLHLQYNGICTDVYMNGSVTAKVNSDTGDAYPYYSSTIYEYPHPCYGSLKTAGTGLSIFDGPLSGSMTMDDIFFVNGYFVVKNYAVDVFEGKTEAAWKAVEDGEEIWNSGKHMSYDSGEYPSGGYVVTNFFAANELGSTIPSLYGSELVASSKEYPKTKIDSERFYDFDFLWHVKPTKPIEFYPESREGVRWHPYYVSKYVDFIKYHNGYYYISLRSTKEHDEGTVGYEIIETDTLFEEKGVVPLEDGLIVSGIRFFDEYVAVEYERVDGEKFMKWFESGKSAYKTMPVKYSDTDPYGTMKHADVETTKDYSQTAAASYDNIEVINSLNRFTPVVNHKSNLFSIRIEDLGFEDSAYLSDYQKSVLRTYFKNGITELVNAVKPAHTQLFDVYLS